MRSIHPHLHLDHIGGFLADHDGRCIGVAADQGRHDRGVNDAQAFEPVNPEFWIDHRQGIANAHLAGADRVIHGIDAGAQQCTDVVVVRTLSVNRSFFSKARSAGVSISRRVVL